MGTGMGMRSRLRVAPLSAVLAWAALPCVVWAQASAVPPSASAGGVSRVALDMSGDANNLHGGSFDASVTWAPFGSIDDTGWRVRLVSNQSRYAYPADERRTRLVRGRSQQTDVMVGYGVVVPGLSVVALLGHASARAEEEGLLTQSEGLRATVSLFASPTPRHMVYASLSHTAMSAYTQFLVKAGFRSGPGEPFVGPEAKADWRRTDPWAQAPGVWRLGGHMSGLSLGGTAWSVSGGRVQDHVLGVGGYLSLGAYAGF